MADIQLRQIDCCEECPCFKTPENFSSNGGQDIGWEWPEDFPKDGRCILLEDSTLESTEEDPFRVLWLFKDEYCPNPYYRDRHLDEFWFGGPVGE